MAQNQLPSTLPSNQEACTLVNPNVQIMSEELKTKIGEDKLKLARIARLQIKQKLKHAGLLRPTEEIEEEAAAVKSRKGKKEPMSNSSHKKHRVKSHAPNTQEFEFPATSD